MSVNVNRAPHYLLLTLVASLVLSRPVEGAGESFLLIVTGLGGEPAYSERFHQWALAMHDAARERGGLPEDHIWYLGEDPSADPQHVQGKSTSEEVVRVLEEIGGRVRPGDQVYIVLIGHGSYRSGESRFNLPGPDLTATDFARLLASFSSQQVVFVNAASASGDFVKELSGENRIVVTATQSGVERNETVFGEYFVQAYASEGADVNKDAHVSVLEAFEYARSHVERFYGEGNRLQTEHAVLDDNGDGRGTHDPSKPEIEPTDGAIAASVFLRAPAEGRAGERADDPELVELYAQIQALEDRVEKLKQEKQSMPPELYMEELEKVLVELAQKNRALKELEGKKERN